MASLPAAALLEAMSAVRATGGGIRVVPRIFTPLTESRSGAFFTPAENFRRICYEAGS